MRVDRLLHKPKSDPRASHELTPTNAVHQITAVSLLYKFIFRLVPKTHSVRRHRLQSRSLMTPHCVPGEVTRAVWFSMLADGRTIRLLFPDTRLLRSLP